MTTTDDLSSDLNATITNAVNARIEAAVLEALSSDEVIGRYVTAALQQPVERNPRGYDHKKEPYITNVVRRVIQEATKEAVKRLLVEQQREMEDEIRKALRRHAGMFAEQMAESLVKHAQSSYGVKVELQLRGDN